MEASEEEFKNVFWVDVSVNIEGMLSKVSEFERLCKGMPKTLKAWKAYDTLKSKIEDLIETVPLLQLLSNESMQTRHWGQLEEVTGCRFCLDAEFKIKKLLAANLLAVSDDVEEISQTSSKELAVSVKLEEIVAQWGKLQFGFGMYKGRQGSYIFKGGEAAELQEVLEESLMVLGGMANSRYAIPFKPEVQEWVNILSETGEVMERWL